MKNILLLILVTSAFSHALAESPAAPKTRIGVLAPLTGDVASWGEDTRRALELADEMIGQGRFTLSFEDDRCLGREAVTGAKKLIGVNQVQFAMTVCSEPTLAVAPMFEAQRVVVVAPGATAAAVSESGDYIFRTWPSDAMIVKAVFDHIKPRYQHVGVLTEVRSMPQEFSNEFGRLASAQGLRVVREEFASEETDFRSLVMRLKRKGPQALLLTTDSDRTLYNLLAQVRALQWDVPIYGNFIVGSAEFLKKGAELAEGVIYGDTPQIVCGPGQQDCEVFRAFNERFAVQSASYMVASAISAYRVIHDAALSGKDPREFLYSNEFESAIGRFRFDENGDVVGPVPTLKRIRNGQAELVASTAR